MLRTPTGMLGQQFCSEEDYISSLGYGPPLILLVKQTADSIEVTEFRNSGQSTRHFSFRGPGPKRDNPQGSSAPGRARIKRNALRLEYVEHLSTPGGRAHTWPEDETWKLSPDSRTLTIRNSAKGTTTYTCQASLDSAMALASPPAARRDCPCGRRSQAPKAPAGYEVGVALGVFLYRQSDGLILFDAGLTGDFFKGLERHDTPNGTEFRMSGHVVSAFPDDVILEITPRPVPTPPAFSWIIGIPTRRLPPEFLDLRFQVKWTGSSIRDLGELPSELLTEPWTEWRLPERLYRLQIPAKGVPLTDSLEVRIFTHSGNQIGCVSGHI